MVESKRGIRKSLNRPPKKKERSNRREKECIGRYAASLVTKGETIYMDGGTNDFKNDSI